MKETRRFTSRDMHPREHLQHVEEVFSRPLSSPSLLKTRTCVKRVFLEGQPQKNTILKPSLGAEGIRPTKGHKEAQKVRGVLENARKQNKRILYLYYYLAIICEKG